MKTILRLLTLVLMLGGWAVAALSIHIVRTPDPNDTHASKLVIVPKARLGISETYVDARQWTASDVVAHADLVRRILEAGKAEQFRFLTDPKNSAAPADQLSDELKASDREHPQPATRNGAHPFSMRTSATSSDATASADDDAQRDFGFRISY